MTYLVSLDFTWHPLLNLLTPITFGLQATNFTKSAFASDPEGYTLGRPEVFSQVSLSRAEAGCPGRQGGPYQFPFFLPNLIPSFFILFLKVLGLTPRLAAAPLGPLTLPAVWVKTPRIWFLMTWSRF